MEVATARVAGNAWAATESGTINRLRSDRSLAERFQAGDEAAFATIYERYRARVNAICIGVLGSSEDALDATQEVFTTVALKLREEPPRELRPWLAKVAHNAAVDIARKRRDTVATPDEAAIPARASNDHLELQELVSALRELPEQQRTALVMRELGGWSYDEIAASLGVDGHAVNGLIARARLGLRAQREAAALVCSAVRESLAGEEDGRRRPAPIRRHLHSCEGCKEFSRALQSDSRTLRALLPGSGLGVLAAILALRPRPVLLGGLGAAKMAFSGVGAPVVAVCALGACTVGGLGALDALPQLPEPLSAKKPVATKAADDQAANASGPGSSSASNPAISSAQAGAGHATVEAVGSEPQGGQDASIVLDSDEGDGGSAVGPHGFSGPGGRRGQTAPFDLAAERDGRGGRGGREQFGGDDRSGPGDGRTRDDRQGERDHSGDRDGDGVRQRDGDRSGPGSGERERLPGDRQEAQTDREALQGTGDVDVLPEVRPEPRRASGGGRLDGIDRRSGSGTRDRDVDLGLGDQLGN